MREKCWWGEVVSQKLGTLNDQGQDPPHTPTPKKKKKKKSPHQENPVCFSRINTASKTCLILTRIGSRFLVSQPGVGEMEYWNIYQSVAYSAAGPLCMLVWSFTTRSQIKYLSHLNKKAESWASLSARVCLRAWGESHALSGVIGEVLWCVCVWVEGGVAPGGRSVLSLLGWRYETHLDICLFRETGRSLSWSASEGNQQRVRLDAAISPTNCPQTNTKNPQY